MRNIVRRSGRWAAEQWARTTGRAPFVFSWLLHKLYPQRSDVIPHHGTVSEGITVAQFNELLAYHARRGHRFISPEDLLRPLDPNECHVLITFDDGYANNRDAVGPLEHHGAVATFHISTGHVERGCAFWWDVLYRERMAAGAVHAAVMAELREWKQLRWEEQEHRLVQLFGPHALVPVGELDRPLTTTELRTMARSPAVRIGDHTDHHLSLPIHSDAEVLASLKNSGLWLAEHLGARPVSLAYPYGHHDDRIVRLAGRAGGTVGFTYEKGHLMKADLLSSERMRMPRNSLTGFLDITTQCHNAHVGAPFVHRPYSPP